MKIKPIVPTADDFVKAYTELHFGDGEQLRRSAIRIAGDRLLDANLRAQSKHIAENAARPPIKTMADHAALVLHMDKMTRLFAEHDALLEAVYPSEKQ